MKNPMFQLSNDERSCRRSERKDDGSVKFKSIVDEYSTSIDIGFS